MLHIVTRAEWGARHPDGYGAAPVPFHEWWLHHSDTAAPADDPAAEAAAMRLLEKIGHERFGGGISYTYAVMPSGRIYQGHSLDREGAHTKGRNDAARAIVLVGDYDHEHVTRAQIDAAAGLLAQTWARGRGPLYLNGGHQDAPGAATGCPGRHGEAAVHLINERAADIAGAQPEGDRDMALSDDDVQRIAAAVWAKNQGATRGGGVELPAQSAGARLDAIHRLVALQKRNHGVLMAELATLKPAELAEAIPLELAPLIVSELARRLHEAPPPAAAPAVHRLVAEPEPEPAPAESVPAAFLEADAAAAAIPAQPSYLEADEAPAADVAAPHASFPWGATV